MRWTVGCASAIRVNISTTWPASVESDLRKVRRTGVLKNRLRTSMTVPGGQPQARTGRGLAGLDRDLGPLGRVGLARLAADLRDLGDRGQRLAPEPQRRDPEQVLGLGQLARRVRLERQRQVVGGHPLPVVGHPDQVLPPRSTVTSIRVAPASIAFSSSSLTTLAGRSITSPAAIWLTTDAGQLFG